MIIPKCTSTSRRYEVSYPGEIMYENKERVLEKNNRKRPFYRFRSQYRVIRPYSGLLNANCT